MRALVIRGSRNVFTVLPDLDGGPGAAGTAGARPASLECRIKGKVLKGVEGFYNPLAPGDWVTVEQDAASASGLILAVEERRNRFTRFNEKGLGLKRDTASQIIAANVDQLLCVCSPLSPPFRPRFLDRILVQAEAAGLPALIVCNKWDLFDGDPDTDERLEDFRRIGYTVLRVSVRSGEGMEELREHTEGKLSVLSGQSGVGKSSLINALLPEAEQRVGLINEKYDRGSHTTTTAALLGGLRGARFIDTPGIRLLLPDGVEPENLQLYMREFAPLAGRCSYGLSCTHTTEPGCKVLEAMYAGVIHEDRYHSFLRIRDELAATGRGSTKKEE
jgi:ribosome biogenesis GTPase